MGQPAAVAVAGAAAVAGGGKPRADIFMQTMKTFFLDFVSLVRFFRARATQTGKAFETPQQAVSALGEAVESTNRAALVNLSAQKPNG